MYFEKKLKEIEMKMPKYFDFSDSNHTRSELQTSSHKVHFHQIPVFPYIKLFTNEVDLLRKLVS
jgi:hypothetical protein